MPQGLQVFDAAGATLVDTSTYTLKAFINIGSVSSNGSIAVPALAEGSPVFAVVPDPQSYRAVVSANSTHVIWNSPPGAASFRSNIYVAIV